MSDFGETWRLVRSRFDQSVQGLSDEQLRWVVYPGTLSIGQMALHVAGVEISFMSQLTGEDLSDELQRVRACSTDGVVNELDFPFSDSEITENLVSSALSAGRQRVEALIDHLTPEIRASQVKSALGPIVDGTGAFARIAYHPGYHQGQVYMVRTAPDFPQ